MVVRLAEPGRTREKEIVYLEDVDEPEVVYVPAEQPTPSQPSYLYRQNLTPMTLEQRQEYIASQKKSLAETVVERGSEYAGSMDDFVVLPSSFMDVSGAGDIGSDPIVGTPRPVYASDVVRGTSSYAGGLVGWVENLPGPRVKYTPSPYGPPSIDSYLSLGGDIAPGPFSDFALEHPGYGIGQLTPDIIMGAYAVKSIPTFYKIGSKWIKANVYDFGDVILGRRLPSQGIGDISMPRAPSFDAYGVNLSQIESISEHNARILMRSESNTPLYRSYFEPYKTNPYQIESLAERNVKIINRADSMKGFADFKIETTKPIDMGYRIPASSPDAYLSTKLPTAKMPIPEPQPVFETIRAPKPYKPLPSESIELQRLVNTFELPSVRVSPIMKTSGFEVPGMFLEMERYMQIRGLSSPDAQVFPSDFAYTDLISKPRGSTGTDPLTGINTTVDPNPLITPSPVDFPIPKITPLDVPSFRAYPKEQPEVLRLPKLSRLEYKNKPPTMPKLKLKGDFLKRRGKRYGKGGYEAWITELTPEDPIKALIRGNR